MNFDRLSASAIKMYLQCPYQFHLKYHMMLPELAAPHPLTLMGSAVHHMFEKATKAYLTKQGSTNPMDYKAEACKEYHVEEHLLTLIDQLVANAIAWGYFRNIDKTAGCELDLNFKLSDGTAVKGIVDRLDLYDDTADIIDLKTQQNLFTAEELLDNWQAKIYNIAVRKTYSQVVNKLNVSFWVIRHQVQKVIMSVEDAVRDEAQLLNIAMEIRSCVEPKPKPSALCKWCQWSGHCPMAGANVKTKLQNKMKGTVVFK